MTEAIIIIGISLVTLSVTLFNIIKLKRIHRNWERTVGIIFDLETKKNVVGDSTITYPIVRFLTINQEWVTYKSFISIIPGFYKKGDEVIIIYDRTSPNNFIIKAKSTYAVLAILLILSIVFLTLGCYILIECIQLQ